MGLSIKDITFTYGKLVKAYTRDTHYDYHDWRERYYNRPGMIHIFHVNESPWGAFDMLAIYINNPGGYEQPYLKTSELVEVTEENGILKATTLNSIYEFELGEFDITEDDKQELMLNRIFKTREIE